MIYTKTKLLLQKHGIVAKKKYGQNFLVDEGVIEDILDAAGICRDDIVLEVGPGIGTLTRYLCERAKHVVAVEIDKKLYPILCEELSVYGNIDIINADILKTDIGACIGELKERGITGNIKVAANLPYYITTPVILYLLECGVHFEKMVFMIQKEVADRMCAMPGTGEYGSLTLAVGYYGTVRKERLVGPGCFIPRPSVDSVVISIEMHEEPPVTGDRELIFKLIRASFNQRRKTLVNGIANFDGLDYTKDEVKTALASIGKKEDIRGEKLSLQDFSDLADALSG